MADRNRISRIWGLTGLLVRITSIRRRRGIKGRCQLRPESRRRMLGALTVAMRLRWHIRIEKGATAMAMVRQVLAPRPETPGL
jgi:hypothetical protein